MIESILEMITALASNVASIIFTNDDVRTRSADCCGWLRHRDGSPIFKILEGGLYEVSFNANVTSATAGTVALGLFQDGVLVPGTTVIAEVVTAGDYYNVSFDKILKLCLSSPSSSLRFIEAYVWQSVTVISFNYYMALMSQLLFKIFK